MTQVIPTSGQDDPGLPIRSHDELVDYFSSAEKPKARFRVGTEHEKFGFLRQSRAPLPYEGDIGIEQLLAAIAADREEGESGSWQEIREAGRLIALLKADASISLEPGGQLELSGAPLATIHETCIETGKHLSLLRRVCLPMGVGFIGMGFHPTATWAELPLVPKSRYAVMNRYLPTVGSRGVDMMKRTCTVQANYDWSSEADMVKSFRAALAVSPLVTALFANSPFYEGRPGTALSERARVWGDTDPRRTGFPQCVFDEGFGYERWVQWALDVPMYFLRRDNTHRDIAGTVTFRDYMKGAIPGQVATMRDFADHLTTCFPEVRVKKVLEVRGADCGPWSRICALPALMKGVLYDDGARDAAYALMDQPTGEELRALHQDVALHGYQAKYRGAPILGLCEDLVDVASAGLARIDAKNWRGEDEGKFLKPLVESVQEGRTFAERLLARFRGEWNGSLDPIWDAVEFWPDQDEEDASETEQG